MTLGARTKVKPPTQISATYSALGGFAINLRWTPVDSGFPASYYVLYRNNAELVSGLTSASYRDTAVVEGGSYAYAVSTVNVNETESVANGPVNVALPSFPVWQTNWSLSMDQNTTESIASRASDPGGATLTFSRTGGTAPALVTVDTDGTVHTGAAAGGTYTLIVSADNGELTSSYTIPMTVTIPIQAPEAPTLTASPLSTTEIALSWQRSPTGQAPTSYRLQRSPVPVPGTWTTIYEGAALSFTDTGLSRSTTYYYRVFALNQLMVSPASLVVSAATLAGSGSATFLIPVSSAARTFNGTTAWALADGSGTKVPAAGDIIEFASGDHGPFKFQYMRGGSGNPIVIRSPSSGLPASISRRLTGQVTTGGFVVEFEGAQYVKWDGSNTPGETYGFVVEASHLTGDQPSVFVMFTDAGGSYITRDIEVNNVEVFGDYVPGGAIRGVPVGMEVNDSASLKSSDTANQYYGKWRQNLYFHHLYIHGTHGEGMYLGPNRYDGHIPLRNVEVSHCLFEDIGREAVQGKSWFASGYGGGRQNSINNCVVRRCGAQMQAAQNSQLSIIYGYGSFYNNRVEGFTTATTPSGNIGLQLWNATDGSGRPGVGVSSESAYGHSVDNPWVLDVYNNVVIATGDGVALSVETGSATFSPPITPRIYNNTVVSCGGQGIRTVTGATGAYYARNNIVMGNTGGQILAGNKASNTESATIPAGKFVNSTASNLALRDLHLMAADAVEVAYNTSIAPTDIEGTARVSASADKGAYEKT